MSSPGAWHSAGVPTLSNVDAEQRLFVSVRPPPSARRELSALPRPATPGVRWVDPEQWHLTLRFLPRAVPAQVIAELDRLDLPQAVVTLGPSVISFEDRVVVIPADGLDGLAAGVLAATRDLAPVDQRTFRGHLTMARTGTAAACPLLGHPISVSFTATTIELVASAGGGSRSAHHTLQTWQLSEPAI